MHDGIFVINFAAGERRESSSVAFGKEDVLAMSFQGMHFSGAMPFTAA
ncbi:TPA: hypothetical protein HA270_05620 [Candidatus Woesearchaeota archaeon]|nr:hypothetical protein [Candidatus Woesearchaeota archaeon]